MTTPTGIPDADGGDDVFLLLQELDQQLVETQARFVSEVAMLQAKVRAAAALASRRSSRKRQEALPKKQNIKKDHLFQIPHEVQKGQLFDDVVVPLPAVHPRPDLPDFDPPELPGEASGSTVEDAMQLLEGQTSFDDIFESLPAPSCSDRPVLDSSDLSGELGSDRIVRDTIQLPEGPRATAFWHKRAVELLNPSGADAPPSVNLLQALWWLRVWGLDGQSPCLICITRRRDGQWKNVCAAIPFGVLLTLLALCLQGVATITDLVHDWGEGSDGRKFRSILDILLTLLTLNSIMMYHGCHCLARKAALPWQEACLVSGLLRQSGQGCETEWLQVARRQQRWLLLVCVVAASLKVLLAVKDEELGGYHLLSALGFCLVSGLNTAIALRVLCTFAAQQLSLSQMATAFLGGMKRGETKAEVTQREMQTVMKWSAQEAFSTCISTVNFPLLLNMLIIVPVQSIVILLEPVLANVEFKDVLPQFAPHVVMGLMPAYAIYKAASINRSCRQIPAMFNSCLAEDFQCSSYKDLMNFVLRCRPGVNVGDLFIDFTLLTRMGYILALLVASLVSRELQFGGSGRL